MCVTNSNHLGHIGWATQTPRYVSIFLDHFAFKHQSKFKKVLFYFKFHNGYHEQTEPPNSFCCFKD